MKILHRLIILVFLTLMFVVTACATFTKPPVLDYTHAYHFTERNDYSEPACDTQNQLDASIDSVNGWTTGCINTSIMPWGMGDGLMKDTDYGIYIAPTENGPDKDGYIHVRVKVYRQPQVLFLSEYVDRDVWINPIKWKAAVAVVQEKISEQATQYYKRANREIDKAGWIYLGNVMPFGKSYLNRNTYTVQGTEGYLVRVMRDIYYFYVIPCGENAEGYRLYQMASVTPDGDYIQVRQFGFSGGMIQPNTLEDALYKKVCQ